MFEGSLWGALYPKKDAFYDLQKLLDQKKFILFLPLQNPSRPEILLKTVLQELSVARNQPCSDQEIQIILKNDIKCNYYAYPYKPLQILMK